MIAAAALLAAILLVTELTARRLGFGSFPLFEPAEKCIYRMQPGQSGRFMGRYAWRYDANGMRNDEVPADFAETTLLVGDSIVDGGLQVAQDETLAAVLSRLAGERVYAVACSGWGLANIIEAVRTISGWERAKRLIFVLNSDDFDVLQRLNHPFYFPRERPAWLTLWFALRKASISCPPLEAMLTKTDPRDPAPAELRALNLVRFRALLAEYPGPVLIVKYPARGEETRAESYFHQLAATDRRIVIAEADEAADWSAECYADRIHPNARGLAILARHISESLT